MPIARKFQIVVEKLTDGRLSRIFTLYCQYWQQSRIVSKSSQGTLWGIENKVHWVLDVVFNKDKSRIRKGTSSENLALIRHIGLNLLRNEKTKKIEIKAKRKGFNAD